MKTKQICRLTVITGNKPIYYLPCHYHIGSGYILFIQETDDEFQVFGVPSAIMNGKEMKDFEDRIEKSNDKKESELIYDEVAKFKKDNRQMLARISQKAVTVVDYY